MDFLQSLLDNSSVPVITAFILGILTAISPCPLATNITAIGFTSALLKKNSFESSSWVEPMDFTSNLFSRLRSLYTQ